MTLAGVAAFAAAHALGLPYGLAAAITAIVVIQSNVGGSLRRAFEQFIGALLGAVYAAAVALAISPDDILSTGIALGIALAPLSILAARSVGFVVAPVTAAVVLLGGTGMDMSATSLALYRVVGVGLGCGIGLLVSVLVVPARASRMAVETAGGIARLLAEQLQVLASQGIKGQAVLGPKATETREKLVRLAALVEEAAHERLAWLDEVPDGHRLLRALRRVRHDVDMLRRTVREAGSDALHDRVATSWQRAAESGAATLTAISQLLAGKHVSQDFNQLAPAVRAYKADIDEMRRTGATHSLSTAVLSRLLGLGFALDQLRRDLDDLTEVARGTSSSRKEFTADNTAHLPEAPGNPSPPRGLEDHSRADR
jgi:uncharacterized membrane protein YccC